MSCIDVHAAKETSTILNAFKKLKCVYGGKCTKFQSPWVLGDQGLGMKPSTLLSMANEFIF